MEERRKQAKEKEKEMAKLRAQADQHYTTTILFYILQFYVRKIKSGDSEESPGWSMRRNLKMTPSPLEMRTWSEPSGSYFTHLATTKI